MERASRACVHFHPEPRTHRRGYEPTLPLTCSIAPGSAPTAVRMPRARMRVTSHVELVEPMAEGSMGELWRGYHHTLATHVAVKIIASAYRDHPVMLDRFHMEAMAAARTKHPHVVQVHDHGSTEDGIAYIVMELLEGQTLRDRLERCGPLDFDETLTIAAQLSDALDAVHAGGVVHRDVKPDNIALLETARGLHAKLFDFGVASVTSLGEAAQLTEPGTLLGTPAYMSVEQMLGADSVDHRTDLWSLAVVIYEMLTGKLPFDDRSLRATCGGIGAGRYRPPSELLPQLGAAIDDWFARAVHPDRERRPSTAAELVGALREVLQPGLPDDELVQRTLVQRALHHELQQALAQQPTLPSSPPLTLACDARAARGAPRRRWLEGSAVLAALAALSWTMHQGEVSTIARSGVGRTAALTAWVALHASTPEAVADASEHASTVAEEIAAAGRMPSEELPPRHARRARSARTVQPANGPAAAAAPKHVPEPATPSLSRQPDADAPETNEKTGGAKRLPVLLPRKDLGF